MAETDGRSAYQGARKLGRKYVSEHANDATHGYLPVLEDRLQGVEILGEINLGHHEIPLRRIIGTRTAMRSNTFAGNWMPLLADDTEFAIKWQKLYMSQLKEGIREPILVYEYLNRYYVQEGNKRVSTMNYVGAASIYGNVIRLIPQRDETNRDITIYYEFLDFDKRRFFDNLWFSHPGMFTRLVEQTEKYIEEHPEITEPVGDVINRVHRSFRTAYKSVNPDVKNVTTGDALMVYLMVFGYPYNESSAELKKNIKSMIPQLEVFSGARKIDMLEATRLDMQYEPKKLKPKKNVHIAFAFDGTPETNSWTRRHAAAAARIERRYGSLIKITEHFDIGDGPDGVYGDLAAIAAEKPTMIICTSPTQSEGALRVSLENPDVIIMNCDIPRAGRDLDTYYVRMYDTTFLCGVLAALQSETGVLGYMDAVLFGYAPTYAINGFAFGAKLINPRAKILQYVLKDVDKFKDYDEACRVFAENGADVAFVRYSDENRLAAKGSPETYAQVYRLDRKTGAQLECLGSMTLDWERFYAKSCEGPIEGRTSLLDKHIPGNPIHFGWGISTGITDVFTNDEVVGVNTVKTVRLFRDLVVEGRLRPFEGPVYDNTGVQRIEPGVVPPLMLIQHVSWLDESIRKLED